MVVAIPLPPTVIATTQPPAIAQHPIVMQPLVVMQPPAAQSVDKHPPTIQLPEFNLPLSPVNHGVQGQTQVIQQQQANFAAKNAGNSNPFAVGQGRGQ